MTIWIVIAYEPVPAVDVGARALRYGALAEQLRRAGHRVVLWTSTFNHPKKFSRFDRDTTITVDPAYTVRLLHAPVYRKNASLGRVRHNRALARAFVREAAIAEAPDVIVAGIPCLELTEAAVRFGNQHEVPVVVDVQDLWPDLYLNVFPRFSRGIARLLLAGEFARARWTCRQATGLSAVSQSYLRWGLTNAQRTVRKSDGVFYLAGLNPFAGGESPAAALRERCVQQFGIDRNAANAVFLGQFGNSYDLTTVLGAAKLSARSNGVRVNYLLAGGGDADADLRRQAAGMGNVRFLGWLGVEDATGVLLGCDIGLATYAAKATQSLPYKPFEYMGAGLPVISSLNGELRTLIERERLGAHYEAGDASSLAFAVDTLAGNEMDRKAAGTRARAVFAKEFDADVVYARFVRHLECVAAERCSGHVRSPNATDDACCR